MKFLAFSLFLFSTLNGISQDSNLELKLDSIVQEADLLFRYEKAVWVSTNLLMSNRKLKNKYGGYVVYHSSDTTYVTFLDKNQKRAIAKYTYINSDFNSPAKTSLDSKEFAQIEQELLFTKMKVIEQLANSKYEVTIPDNFQPNLVLIKTYFGYHLYILMGTNESGLIPFGNDYLFKIDTNAEIIEWEKFHSRVIPVQSEIPGKGKVQSSTHSHRKSTPYITATDICTFRLYAQYTKLIEFSVYSPALGKYMKYNIETNKIEITE